MRAAPQQPIIRMWIRSFKLGAGQMKQVCAAARLITAALIPPADISDDFRLRPSLIDHLNPFGVINKHGSRSADAQEHSTLNKPQKIDVLK